MKVKEARKKNGLYDRQTDYYQALREADKTASAIVFIEFMLDAILQALVEIHSSEQVSEQVGIVLSALQDGLKGEAGIAGSPGIVECLHELQAESCTDP